MDSFYNDPLGALSSGLSKANQSIKKNVNAAAENLRNNEQLQ
jgi:hypothetical protein